MFLGNPRVPKGEKQRLQAEYDRSMRVVAEIDASDRPGRETEEGAA